MRSAAECATSLGVADVDTARKPSTASCGRPSQSVQLRPLELRFHVVRIEREPLVVARCRLDPSPAVVRLFGRGFRRNHVGARLLFAESRVFVPRRFVCAAPTLDSRLLAACRHVVRRDGEVAIVRAHRFRVAGARPEQFGTELQCRGHLGVVSDECVQRRQRLIASALGDEQAGTGDGRWGVGRVSRQRLVHPPQGTRRRRIVGRSRQACEHLGHPDPRLRIRAERCLEAIEQRDHSRRTIGSSARQLDLDEPGAGARGVGGSRAVCGVHRGLSVASCPGGDGEALLDERVIREACGGCHEHADTVPAGSLQVRPRQEPGRIRVGLRGQRFEDAIRGGRTVDGGLQFSAEELAVEGCGSGHTERVQRLCGAPQRAEAPCQQHAVVLGKRRRCTKRDRRLLELSTGEIRAGEGARAVPARVCPHHGLQSPQGLGRRRLPVAPLGLTEGPPLLGRPALPEGGDERECFAPAALLGQGRGQAVERADISRMRRQHLAKLHLRVDRPSRGQVQLGARKRPTDRIHRRDLRRSTFGLGAVAESGVPYGTTGVDLGPSRMRPHRQRVGRGQGTGETFCAGHGVDP